MSAAFLLFLFATSTYFFSGTVILPFYNPSQIAEVKAVKTVMLPTPTLTPTPTPTLTLTPTPTLRPTATPTPMNTPTPLPSDSPSSSQEKVVNGQNTSQSELINSNEQSLLQEVNNYRASQGLSNVSPNKETCDFARIRVLEIASAFNHDGFSQRLESHTLPYPSYSEVTENIAMNSDSTKVVGNWINSPGHAENMRKDTPFVCIKSEGNYFVYLGWRP